MVKGGEKVHKKGRSVRLLLCALFCCMGIALYVFYPVLVPSSIPVLQTPSTIDLADWPKEHPAYPFVNYLAQQQILRIQPGKNFKPDEAITRAELALLLSSARGLPEKLVLFPHFKDVGRNNPARGAIEAVAWAGIMTGYPDRTFRPEEPVTRAELAQLAFSLSDSKLTSIDLPPGIEDVPDNHPQRDYIAGALDAELMTLVVPGKFKPEADATNAEAVRAIAVMMTISPEKREVPLNGILVPIKGKTLMKTAGQKEIEVKSNITVPNNTTIRVGPASEAELRFPDGSGFKLTANSEMTIKAARGRATIRRDGSPGTAIEYLELALPHGKSFGALASTNSYPRSKTTDNPSEKEKLSSNDSSARTVSRGNRAVNNTQKSKTKAQSKDTGNEVPWWREAEKKKVKVKVDMPWGVSAIRGTFWLNTVSPEGQSTSVLIGKTEFTGAGVSQEIAPGYSSTIPAEGQAPGKPNPFSVQEKKEWKEAQAWVMERARAIRENSPLVDSAMLAIKPPPGISAAPELVTPALPPVVDEVTRALYEAAMAEKTREGGILPDYAAPQVSSTDPAGDSPNVALDKTIKISFKENVVPGPNYGEIKLKEGDKEIPADFTINGSIMKVVLAANLSYNKHYTVEIPTGAVQDASGNPLQEPYSLSFSTPQPWQIEDLPGQGGVTSERALTLDAAGNPHVCLCDNANDQIEYVYRSTEGWNVENALQYGSDPCSPSMVLDQAGMPHIFFVDAPVNNWTLQHAWKTSSGWHQEEVNDDVNLSTPSLAIDGSGRIHVSYSNDEGLLYSCRDNSGWHTEPVEKVGKKTPLLTIDSSIAVDQQGRPHVTYCRYLIEVGTTQSLRYAWRDSSGWHIEKVDGGDPYHSVGKKNSLALDDQGNPHVSYYKENQRLGYAWRESGTWQLETPEPNIVAPFFETSLQLDKSGHPYINYYTRYITKDDQGWHGEELGGSGSLVLDSNGYAWVAYNTKIARRCPQGDVYPPVLSSANPANGETGVDCARIIQIGFNENVEPGTNFAGIVLKNERGLVQAHCMLKGNPVVLTITPTADMRPSTQYTIAIPPGAVKDSSGNPNSEAYNIVFNISHNWLKEEVYEGSMIYDSMVFDSRGYAHISGRIDNKLVYLCDSPNGWNREVVDLDNDVEYTAIALNSQDTPCIAYSARRNGDILYAFRDKSGWHIEKIRAAIGGALDSISLSLDGNGNPHVVYKGGIYNSSQGFVCYAYRDSSGWHIDNLDEKSRALSLALDAAGNPHLTYEHVTDWTYEHEKADLFYAWRDQTGWHHEKVASSQQYNFLQGETSLALDSYGRPQILYNDQGLLFFTRTSNGWQVEHLYKGEANDISLAIGTGDVSQVVFRDWQADTIKYMTVSGGVWSGETLTSAYKDAEMERNWDLESALCIDKSGVPSFLVTREQKEKTSAMQYQLYRIKLSSRSAYVAPQVLMSDPMPGQVAVKAGSDIGISVDQNIWPGPAFGGIRLQADSNTIPVFCSTRGNVLVIDPVDDLPPGAKCTITVPAGAVENNGGQTLARAYDLSFTSTNAWQVDAIATDVKVLIDPSMVMDTHDNPHMVYEDYHSEENRDLVYMTRDASGWHTRKIDAVRSVVSLAIKVDREGYPHIIYLDFKDTVEYLKYAWQDQRGWHHEIAGSWTSRGAILKTVQLVLDDAGRPYVTFDLKGNLYCAWKDSSGWQVEEPWDYDENQAGGSVVLAVDRSGAPFILYSYNDKHNVSWLDILQCDKKGWHRQELGKISRASALQADSSGQLHRAYGRRDGALIYGRLQSGKYSEETVITSNDDIKRCYLRQDSAGNPEIIYFADNMINRAWRTLSGWKNQPLASANDYGLGSLVLAPIMVLDSAGNPHEVWVGDDFDKIMYASLDVNDVGIGATYPAAGASGVAADQLMEIVYNKDISAGPALEQAVLLQGGQEVPVQQVVQGRKLILVPLQELLPGAAYSVKLPAGAVRSSAGTASPAYDFNFTTAASSWQNQTIDSTGDVGRYASAAADAAGNPRVSYYDNSNHTLKYAVRSKTGWQTETADQAGDVGSYSSLAIDAQGISHISYYDATNKALKYASRNKSGWQTEIVDSSGDVGSYSSLDINGGKIGISYYDVSQRAIKYAERINNTWVTVTVSRGSTGGHTTLFLDAAGNPHIAYYDAGSGDLQYAFRTSSGWQVEAVDSAGDAGYYPSLVINPAGQPCISYYEADSGVLKYAVKQGGKWQIETVDNSKQAGFYTSLQLDGAGNPCISYYDSRGYDLKYAVKRSGTWQIETVFARGMVGAYSSLSLDSADHPLIFYYDGTSQDLKCSQLLPKW